MVIVKENLVVHEGGVSRQGTCIVRSRDRHNLGVFLQADRTVEDGAGIIVRRGESLEREQATDAPFLWVHTEYRRTKSFVPRLLACRKL